jgi:hypothetical protein
VPDITDILINGLEQITITENEVEDILKIFDTSKAIGPDLLNPRLLKEAASILKYPLCRLVITLIYHAKYTNEGNWSVVFQITGTMFFKNGGTLAYFLSDGKVES